VQVEDTPAELLHEPWLELDRQLGGRTDDLVVVARRLLRKELGAEAGNAVLQRFVAEMPAAPQSIVTYADLRRKYKGTTYLWPGWIPNAQTSLVGGPQGAGKSYLLAAICKAVTLGARWPDGEPYTAQTGKVVWADTEAGQGLTLERLARFGVPDDGILALLDGETAPNLDNPAHREEVRRLMLLPDVVLGIVDALRGAHKRDENSSETYAIVQFLAELARDTGKPIVVAHHIRKAQLQDGEPSLDWFRGSSAITQTTRCCWILYNPLGDRDSHDRALVQVKHNGSPKLHAVGVRLLDHGVEPCPLPRPPSRRPELDEAVEFLLAALVHGAQPWIGLVAEGQANGISARTLERGRDALKRAGKVRRFEREGHTVWGMVAL
jgi:hypothetical protein